MIDLINELLPFYVNGTLTPAQSAAVEEHLAGCDLCRVEVEEWRTLAAELPKSGIATTFQNPEVALQKSAAQVQSAATGLQAPAAVEVGSLPPLSPVVRLSLRPHGRRDLRQALREAVTLVAAQRAILRQALLLPALAAAILLAVLGTLVLPRASGESTALAFVAIVPIVAVLVVTYLYTFDRPGTFEMVAATPTAPNALLWARLTLLLGVIAGMAFGGSLAVALLDGGQLLQMVGAWLGPMLWLSALSTLLSLLWRPYAASGLALVGWVGLLLALAQGSGDPARAEALSLLLSPGWALLAGELALASLLWLACWRVLRGGVPRALRLEER